MARRICLFDIDGTLTKPRNVAPSHLEDRYFNERNSQGPQKGCRCWVCGRKWCQKDQRTAWRRDNRFKQLFLQLKRTHSSERIGSHRHVSKLCHSLRASRTTWERTNSRNSSTTACITSLISIFQSKEALLLSTVLDLSTFLRLEETVLKKKEINTKNTTCSFLFAKIS